MFDSKIVKKSIKKAVLIACLASVPLAALTPPQLARFQARSFTSTSTSVTLPYRLFVPDNYNAANRYPLVTALHGHGERGTNNTGQFAFGIAKQWIQDSVQARVPHFILAPHSAVGWTDLGQRKTLMEIVEALKREFSLDTNRFYVTGLSGGAMGVWSLLKEYPGMFAAAVPCAGSTWGNLTVTAIVRTPFWAFHGSADETVPVSGTRDIVAAVEKLGYPVVRFVSSANRVNPTAISYDSLTRAVYGGAKYLYSEITGGNHFAGWNEAWAHPLLPHWVLSKTRGSTAVVPLTRNAEAPSSPRLIRVSGMTTVCIPPSWRGKADAAALYTVSGRRLGRAGIADKTVLDFRAMGYGAGVLFVKPIATKGHL